MSNKIPTAEEFFNQYGGYTREEMLERAREYAKLHVKAALEAAQKEAMKFCDENEDEEYKPQILSAYPEHLIQ